MGLTAFFCLIFYVIPLNLFFQSKLEYDFIGTLLSFVLYGLLVYILSRAHLGPLPKVFTATDINVTSVRQCGRNLPAAQLGRRVRKSRDLGGNRSE